MTELSVEAALKECAPTLAGVATFSFVANLLMLAPAFFMLNVYDKAVGHNSLPTLWVLSALTLFMFLVLGIMERVRSYLLVAVSSKLDEILAPPLFEAVFADAALRGPKAASIQPLSDLASLRQFLTGAGIFALFDAPWLPVYVFVLFLFHPLLGWMGIIASIAFFVLAVLNQRVTTRNLTIANEHAVSNDRNTILNLRNAEAAASMGMMEALKERWRNTQDELIHHQELASNHAGFFNAVIKTLRIAIQSAAIAAGAYLVLEQEISPGMLIAGSILIGRALQPVELAVGAWRGFAEAIKQKTRIDEVLSKEAATPSSIVLPPITGVVEAASATVVPPGSRNATLNSITFKIPAGSVCVVLGTSGAGKSTLIRAMLGLWPTTLGEIRIDGTESSLHGRGELGSQIGYLPQDIELLDGTVAENISRFGELDSEAIITAAQDAGIHELILGLPDGYDTRLSATGVTLSQGQQQRVALARALYRRPKLILLDEPNSNLDEAGELALTNAIKLLKENGSTVVLVTHRQTVLALADYLMILADGRLARFGETSDVMTNLKKDGHIASQKPSPQKQPAAPSKTVPVNTVSWDT